MYEQYTELGVGFWRQDPYLYRSASVVTIHRDMDGVGRHILFQKVYFRDGTFQFGIKALYETLIRLTVEDLEFLMKGIPGTYGSIRFMHDDITQTVIIENIDRTSLNDRVSFPANCCGKLRDAIRDTLKTHRAAISSTTPEKYMAMVGELDKSLYETRSNRLRRQSIQRTSG